MIFVKVKDGIVIECIVADQDFIDSYIDTSAGTWLETREDGSIRKNYAGIGFTYDAQNDLFIAPKPFESWVLNEETFIWESPVKYPNDGNNYKWNEDSLEWWIIGNSV
nr:hypothetical protein [uncultured Mediterranean phage uvMED]